MTPTSVSTRLILPLHARRGGRSLLRTATPSSPMTPALLKLPARRDTLGHTRTWPCTATPLCGDWDLALELGPTRSGGGCGAPAGRQQRTRRPGRPVEATSLVKMPWTPRPVPNQELRHTEEGVLDEIVEVLAPVWGIWALGKRPQRRPLLPASPNLEARCKGARLTSSSTATWRRS